jgi:hypothetical protein
MRRFYIYAGTAEQGRQAAHDMGLEPREWCHVTTVGMLAGLRKQVVILCGTYRERKDADQFTTMAKEREHTLLYKL